MSVARIDFVLLCWWPRGRCESEGGHLPSGLSVASSFCFARLLSAFFVGVTVAKINYVSMCWWQCGRFESKGGASPSGLGVASTISFALLLFALFDGVSEISLVIAKGGKRV